MAEISSQPGGDDTERSNTATRQQDDRRKKGFDPTEDEKTVVKQWLERVERAETEDLYKQWRENLKQLRGYVDGTVHKEKGGSILGTKLVRTNMVYATIAAQMPELYAKNPVIEVDPTDAVGEQQMGKIKKFAGSCEKVIRKVLVNEGKLKKRAKANIRSAQGTGFGVLKMLPQEEYRGDGVIIRRIEDTQDQLAQVEQLVQQIKEKNEDATAQAQRKDELASNLKALQSHEDIRIYKGLAVDRMKSEDFLILDDSIKEFDEYVDASALGHKVWMTVKQAMLRWGFEELVGATRYGAPHQTDAKIGEVPANEQYICAIEIWDKANGVVRTTAKGMNRWLVEPYAPQYSPQRWYPFYVLGFNPIEGRWRPLSDVELLQGLQDEYNQTRQNFADARERCVPVIIVRKSGNLKEEDVKAVTNRGNKDTIAVSGNPTIPISQDVMFLEVPRIDPMAYDVTMIRNDMDLVTGRSDASRANLIKPKTATEAEIMNEAMQSRVGERRDAHEDLLSEMGEAALEISLKLFTRDEVMKMAGEDCEWPEHPPTAEEIFNQVTVSVRAGSSGRPNQQKEREQWTQLLPVIKETMQAVGEMRQIGNFEGADAAMALLRETLSRFDENLDIDSIIPPVPLDENGKPVMQQQLGMELQKCKEQLQLCQEELQKCQQDLEKAKQGAEAKAIQAQSDADVALAESQRKDAVAKAENERKEQEFQRDQERKDEEFEREQARKDRELDHKIAMETRAAEHTEATENKAAEHAQGMEKETMAREERLATHKVGVEADTRLKTEKVKAEVAEGDEKKKAAAEKSKKDEDAARSQFTEVLKGLGDAVKALRETTAELSEISGSDRVPEYGPDGMPSRLRVERKPKGKGDLQ